MALWLIRMLIPVRGEARLGLLMMNRGGSSLHPINKMMWQGMVVSVAVHIVIERVLAIHLAIHLMQVMGGHAISIQGILSAHLQVVRIDYRHMSF